jgi:hypothetical protein
MKIMWILSYEYRPSNFFNHICIGVVFMMVVLVLSVLNYQFELSAYLLVLKLSTTLDAC